MIAGGCGDHTAGPLGGLEQKQRVAGSTFLEAAGPLEQVELAPDLAAGEVGERDARRAGGAVDARPDAVVSLTDVVERNGGGCHEVSRSGR